LKLFSLSNLYIDQFKKCGCSELADYLGLNRPASARFWRIKATEMLRANQEIGSRKPERNTEELPEESVENRIGMPEESAENAPRHFELTPEETRLSSAYEKTLSWLMDGRSTVSLKVVSETMNQSMKLLRNRVASKRIQATKNKEIVRKDSVIAWAISEVLPKENQRIGQRQVGGNLEAIRDETDGQSETQRRENLEEMPGETGRQRDKQMGGNREGMVSTNGHKTTEVIPVSIKTHEDIYTRDNVVSATPKERKEA